MTEGRDAGQVDPEAFGAELATALRVVFAGQADARGAEGAGAELDGVRADGGAGGAGFQEKRVGFGGGGAGFGAGEGAAGA